MKPLPIFIAKGDLDGDYYFECWDENILSHIEAEEIIDMPMEPEMEVMTTETREDNGNQVGQRKPGRATPLHIAKN